MAGLKEILSWFEKNNYPTQEQFKESWTSFWHKSEKMPMEQVVGLQDELSDKALKSDLNAVETELKDKASKEDLANVVAGLVPMGSVANLTELEAKPKRNNDAYYVEDQLSPEGNAYIYRWDAGLNLWVNTKQVVFKDVITQGLGDSSNKVMSQKAVTDEIAQLAGDIQKVVKNSNNIFNINKIISGGFFDSNSPFAWIESSTISTYFVDVLPNDVIYIKSSNTTTRHITYKDSAGTIYTGQYLNFVGNILTIAISTSSQARQIGIQLYNSELSTLMITKNQNPPETYEPYLVVNPDFIIEGSNISDNSIEKTKINFDTVNDILLIEDKNLNIFDKSKAILGGYYKDGVWVESPSLASFSVEYKTNDIIYYKRTRSLTSFVHISFRDIDNTNVYSYLTIGTDGLITISTADTRVKLIHIMLYMTDIDDTMITVNQPIPNKYIPFGGNINLFENIKYAISIHLNNQEESDDYLENRLLIWEDNFDGNDLDLSNWNTFVRQNMPSGLEANTDRSKNVRVENSKLIIQARRENYNGKSWTSAQINTSNKRQFKYGRIEAKMKLPVGDGMWPAFWLLGAPFYFSFKDGTHSGSNGAYPYCGEVDIMEFYGTQQHTESRVHSPSNIQNQIISSPILKSQNINVGDFNIYGIEWTENEIQFLVNNAVIGTFDINTATNNGHNPYREPHYIILNLAVRNTASSTTLDINTMEVDWVRVYAPTSQSTLLPATGISVAKRNATIETNIYQSIPLVDSAIDNLNLSVNEKVLLIATVVPEDAEKTVVWKSENEDIVSCINGVVQGLKVGEALISVRTSNYIYKTINVVIQ